MKDVNAPGGIRTHISSNRAAADPLLRPLGHWDRQRYSSTLSLTSTLDGGGWLKPRPVALPTGKRPGTLLQEAGWAPGPVWTGAESLVPAGIRSPDRAARSQSLYQLRHPGPRA